MMPNGSSTATSVWLPWNMVTEYNRMYVSKGVSVKACPFLVRFVSSGKIRVDGNDWGCVKMPAILLRLLRSHLP